MLEHIVGSSLLLLTVAQSATSKTMGQSPFGNAKAVWHMADRNSESSKHPPLTVYGNVRLGVSLKGSEREASICRGGDGQVAEFKGGYLIAGAEATDALHISGNKMTFYMRLRDLAGKWDVPLFTRQAPKDELGRILYPAALNKRVVGFPQAKHIEEGRAIEFMWRTTPLKQRVHPEYFAQDESTNWFKFIVDWEAKYTPARKGDFVNGVLRLQAPTELIDPYRWHDIIVRFNRTKIEMFVDGVLLDADWPHGSLYQFQGPFLIGAGFQAGKLLSGFHGQIDHVALWDRALTDEEIVALSGGTEKLAQRDLEMLGKPRRVGQYWRPRGYNTFIGDCMAFSHDDTFHVFFLSDRRHGGGKWGMQGLPWGHISTKDLIHWTEHPCPLDITEPWECCLGTGSLAYHDGNYYLFYIKHDRRAWFRDNPRLGDTIFVATSSDGINFKKGSEPLFIPEFFNINDINPDIYPDETNGGFLLSLSNWKVWKSRDLKHWEERANISTPQWWVCTSYFKWNGWYYFTSCGLHWRSQQSIEKSTAKWESPFHQTLQDGIRVPQVASFKNRYIMVGFTPEPPETYYAGELLIRELIQHPDGILGTKWPEEIIPKSSVPLKLPFKAVVGDAFVEGNAIRINAPDGLAVGALIGVPQNVRIMLQVKSDASHFGICVRGQGDYAAGCELQFDPARERVQFAPVSDGHMAEESGHWMAIGGVTGIAQPFTLDLIIKDDLVDACIDNRRTIITRNRAKFSGDRLFFFVNHGEVAFAEIQIRPLLED